uniref:RxLR effector candidate protein n=2 Tax=Hyaloperonospora arabidopsidis (strain Emoy2) TaxID=559515 RepID=M4BPI6_HYAAE
MRLHYVAHVIAAALAASAYGLQAVPDAANLSPLQTSTEVQHQTNVAEKTERFLASDDKDLPLMVTSTEPLLSAQQEGGAGRQLRAYYNKSDWDKYHHKKGNKGKDWRQEIRLKRRKKGNKGKGKDWRQEIRLKRRKKWNAEKKLEETKRREARKNGGHAN